MRHAVTVVPALALVVAAVVGCAETEPLHHVSPETGISADLLITTAWDDEGLDWELHLVKPGGRINDDATDCTWTSCIDASPDWGALSDPSDDPHKDVDNTDADGPEHIRLSGLEDGAYTVMVEHWSPAGSAHSDGDTSVDILGHVVDVGIHDFAPEHVWTVARVHWPEAHVEVVDDVVDCSADWDNGCHAALP